MAATLVASACGSTDGSAPSDAEVAAASGGRCSPGDAASMYRVWNDAALDAIRLDFPAPTVHARNLYHLSATMWDVWRAYEPVDSAGSAVFVDEQRSANDVVAARDEALAFAAHRVLTHRYQLSLARPETRLALNNTLGEVCPGVIVDDVLASSPNSAAAFGVAIADEVIAATIDDGSLERKAYEDVDYRTVNPPLDVAESGTDIADPDRWQPLLLETSVSQNGVPLPGGEQTFVGPNWGSVVPFALEVESQPPLDQGPPPRAGDPASLEEYRAGAVVVLEASADLEVGVRTIDIGPGSTDVATLDYESSGGHVENPATGEPYAANEVDAADYYRAIAEYWADGPTSETPPGHWNSLANAASDALDPADRLRWDVQLGLVLNGALHDAAIAAWGNKAFYDSVRPISMIRWMAQPESPVALREQAGLVEVVTAESAAPGERHDGLSVGEIAVRTWAGSPADPEIEVSGVTWIRAVDWVPYQRDTFVTPAFAGFVSGHSVFSRAGAEVLAGFTGSEFFPGGIVSHEIAAGSFLHEEGPSSDMTLQWATYLDAADEAGRSRIWGGIHVPADDEIGRLIGSEVGRSALSRAEEIFG